MGDHILLITKKGPNAPLLKRALGLFCAICNLQKPKTNRFRYKPADWLR